MFSCIELDTTVIIDIASTQALQALYWISYSLHVLWLACTVRVRCSRHWRCRDVPPVMMTLSTFGAIPGVSSLSRTPSTPSLGLSHCRSSTNKHCAYTISTTDPAFSKLHTRTPIASLQLRDA